MKIFAVMASPHSAGNTATLLEQVLAGARSANIETHRVDLYSLQIAPCQGCMACKNPNAPGCAQKDDMQALYPQVLAADILVWATPMYWWNVSGSLKNFIDRLLALPSSGLQDKTLLLVMTTGAAPAEDGRQGLELLFKEVCAYTGMTYAGFVTAGSAIPISKQASVLEAAFIRGASLGQA